MSKLAEMAVKKAKPYKTAAAYVRTTYFEERRIIMQKWTDYLDAVKSGAQCA